MLRVEGGKVNRTHVMKSLISHIEFHSGNNGEAMLCFTRNVTESDLYLKKGHYGHNVDNGFVLKIQIEAETLVGDH